MRGVAVYFDLRVDAVDQQLEVGALSGNIIRGEHLEQVAGDALQLISGACVGQNGKTQLQLLSGRELVCTFFEVADQQPGFFRSVYKKGLRPGSLQRNSDIFSFIPDESN